jgi:hypothetical protein
MQQRAWHAFRKMGARHLDHLTWRSRTPTALSTTAPVLLLRRSARQGCWAALRALRSHAPRAWLT